ncbi:hypothetical protein LTR86_010181, partial [Recurvomyces mirabilis]
IPTGLSVTFSDDNAQSTCSNDTASNGPASAISVKTSSYPASFTCFNLNETWTRPNVTYNTRPYKCSSSNICGVNYTLGGVENWNAQANYSNYYYSQATFSSNFSKANGHDVGQLSFQTYAGWDCQQQRNNELGAEVLPWIQSNCITDGGCFKAPYNIRSFALVPSGTNTGQKGCTVGNSRGGDPALSASAARLSKGVLLPLGIVLVLAVWL